MRRNESCNFDSRAGYRRTREHSKRRVGHYIDRIVNSIIYIFENGIREKSNSASDRDIKFTIANDTNSRCSGELHAVVFSTSDRIDAVIDASVSNERAENFH